MLVANISSLILLRDFILFLNCDLDLVINMFFYLLLFYIMLFDCNTLTIIDKKSIEKNKEDNNNLKLIDQLVLKKDVDRIAI